MGNGLYDLRENVNYADLPRRAYQVKAIIGDTSAAFVQANNLPLTSMQFFNNRINALEQLKETLRAQEENFYTLCKVKGITELNKKVQIIDMANQSFSAEAIYDMIMKDPNIQASLSGISIEGINAALEDIDWGETLLEEGDDLDSYAIQIVNQYLENSGLKFIDTSKEKVGGFFAGMDQEGFGFKRVFEVKKRGKQIKILVKGGAQGSRRLLDKMLIAIQNKTGGTKAKNLSEFRQYFWQLIDNYVKSQNGSKFSSYLKKELNRATDLTTMLYDVNRSESKIKGMIQEVWANTLLAYLTGDQAIPTGNIKNNLYNKTEVGIDSVLKSYNFQIKRYSLDADNRYQIRETGKEATTLLSQQRGSLGELMLQFFGSYQYNQPIKDRKGHNPSKGTMTIEEYESNIYNQFYNIINNGSLDKAFQANMDYIMRIENYIQSDKGTPFAEPGQYRNTFFIVNSMFIPASLMVQCIIDEMIAAQPLNIIRFHLVNAKTQSSPVFQEDYLKEKTSVSVEDAAQKVKLDYTIDLDFTQILTRAYAKAQAKSN